VNYRAGASTFNGASARAISFSSAMPSTSYQVLITPTAALGVNASPCYTISSVTVNGFSVQPINCNGGAALNATSAFNWMAIETK